MKDQRQWKKCPQLLMVNFNTIENTINYYIENKSKIKNEIVDDYNVNNVSDKVVKIINSYIDFINFEVWKKN